jgi:transketolase
MAKLKEWLFYFPSKCYKKIDDILYVKEPFSWKWESLFENIRKYHPEEYDELIESMRKEENKKD